MTIEVHYRRSKENHNRRKKKEIQEERNREFLELARDIWCFEKRIQAVAEETQRYGWVMRKRKVRWHSLQMKLRKNIYVRLKEELREVESEMEVSYCEPKQGPFLGVDDEAENERLIESLMDSIKSTYQLVEDMTVSSNETKRSYVFESDDLFVIIGFVVDVR